MLYEAAAVVRAELDEAGIAAIKSLVTEVTKEFKGEIVIADDWGTRTFAQPRESGATRGRYLYFVYTGTSQVNAELERRLRINETVMTYIITKVGERVTDRELLVKNYRNPFTAPPATEEEGEEGPGSRRFGRSRNCWFTANKFVPDWKYPQSYTWILN
jgi:ribosomal protein S6